MRTQNLSVCPPLPLHGFAQCDHDNECGLLARIADGECERSLNFVEPDLPTVDMDGSPYVGEFNFPDVCRHVGDAVPCGGAS